MPEPVSTSSSIIASLFGLSPDQAAQYATMIAGVVGGIISGRFIKGMNKVQFISGVLAGGILADYLTKPIVSHFEVKDNSEFVAFLIGLFGLSICGAVFDAIKNSDIWGLVEKWFSRNTGA